MQMRMVLGVMAAAVSMLAQEAVAPAKKTALFNGKNLDGWYSWLRENKYQDPKQVFTVSNGVIRISGEEWGGIATKQQYRDYHLVVEWKWGGKAWGARADKARDSGILIHGTGEDGAYSGVWLESIEAQIIEGGAGDLLFVGVKNKPSGTATVRKLGKEIYWDPKGEPVTRDSGRVNWWGRWPEWKDALGIRGPMDVEKKLGEWNRQEVYAYGDKVTYVVNGKVVNHAYGLSVKAGKIQIQSEGAEIMVRKVEIGPVGKVPALKMPSSFKP